MKLNISDRVKEKLAQKHNIQISEVIECFANGTNVFLEDLREEHKTNPPSQWFVAETDFGRKLKVVFIQDADGSISIKTAYIANPEEIRIYSKFANV